MAKKKKDVIIKPTPADIMSDISFQCGIINHVNAFGFSTVIENVIEAYRREARRFNKHADKLEKATLKQDLFSG